MLHFTHLLDRLDAMLAEVLGRDIGAHGDIGPVETESAGEDGAARRFEDRELDISRFEDVVMTVAS